jgi:hypothetical protein
MTNERGSRGCRSSLAGSILLDPFGASALEAGRTGATDRRPAAVVLVVRGDVADRSVQAHRVVLAAYASELGIEGARVADLGQVWPVPFR